MPQARRPWGRWVSPIWAVHGPEVASILITTAVGVAGVRGLLISDFLTDRDCRAFGVTRQLQQEIISSAGSKVYRLAHKLDELDAPELVIFTNESATLRLAAYVTWKVSSAKAVAANARVARTNIVRIARTKHTLRSADAQSFVGSSRKA